MSRKFDRARQVRAEVKSIIESPMFMRQLFKPKPRWMPLFIFRLLVGLVLRK